jgi:hypothetical protein
MFVGTNIDARIRFEQLCEHLYRSTYGLQYESDAMFRFLLSYSPQKTTISRILVHAAMQGRVSILKECFYDRVFAYLLDTFLYYGVIRNHVEVVRFALRHGVSIYHRSEALEIAVRNQQINIFQLLIPTRLMKQAKRNALHDALLLGNMCMVRDLLLHGAKY